ncbi:MAG: TIGR03084 family metal-binding protein [Ilumatobacteraceae bacterium]
MDVHEVLDDLVAEQEALDAIVTNLTASQWQLPTPSPGWSVADQIGHLTYFDGTAALAIEDPAAFADEMSSLFAGDGRSADDMTLGAYRAMSPDDLLDAWRTNRTTLGRAGATLANDTRVAWYGPSMGSKSFLTARLMEAWAHGQDIVDTVGASRPPTDRLRHIANLGFITRGWTYANRGIDAPSTPVRVELLAPSGDVWTFGPDDATESVTGPAEDFCLVTTQRRHVDDTALVVIGDAARDWMLKAQLFAGPPSDGPSPEK